MKMICRLLIVSLLFFSYHTTAGMIGTERVATAPSAQTERMQIQIVLSRAEVASALQAMGVDVNAARDRVAALTDEEARSLAGKLGTLPAGADSDGWWIVAIVVVVGLLLWWRWR
jgi:hypothetical protein